MSEQFTECFNPATGEILGTSRLNSAAEVLAVIKNARTASETWQHLPLKSRINYIRRVQLLLADRAEDLAEIISRDNGKPIIDAMVTEIVPAVMAADYYCGKARKFLKKQRIGFGNILLSYKVSTLYRVPFGVVGIISPWNYPFTIPFSEIVMALLAGNTVVVKTATDTQFTGRALEKLFLDAGFPAGVFNYVNISGRQAGELFLAGHPAGVDKLFFTGSVATGKTLMKMAGETLTPVSLELGGNDPMIVCEDADLDRAAAGAVWAGLSNCGQSCGGIERIYVVESVYEPFIEKLKRRVELLRIGSDDSEIRDLGAMTTDSQVRDVTIQLEDALSKGAHIYAQNSVPQELKGKFMPAMVITQVNHTMKLMQEETFGPLLAVMKVRNINEAVQLSNDANLGLTGSVWSKNRKKARTIARQVRAGAVTVNDHLMSHGLAETPWGGFRESGIGRTHGKLGFDEMTQPQVIVNDILPFVRQNMWWQPYSPKIYRGILGIIRLMYRKGIIERISGGIELLKLFPRYFIREE